MHVQNRTLLLDDELMNFRNMCFNISELDPAKFYPAALKRANVKLDMDMIILVEKCIKGGICHSIYRYKKRW